MFCRSASLQKTHVPMYNCQEKKITVIMIFSKIILNNFFVDHVSSYDSHDQSGPDFAVLAFPRFLLKPRHPTGNASKYAFNFCVSMWPNGCACCTHVVCQRWLDPAAILAECLIIKEVGRHYNNTGLCMRCRLLVIVQ